MTCELAHAAGWDAGNRSARAAGRAKWDGDDLHTAHDAFIRAARLIPSADPDRFAVLGNEGEHPQEIYNQSLPQ